MERFTAQQLVEYLANNCGDLDDDSLDVIRKAKVSGKRALKFSPENWTKVGLAYGDVLDVVEAIKQYAAPDKENTPPQSTPTSSAQSVGSQSSTNLSVKAVAESTKVVEEESSNRFDCLRPYFTPEEFDNLTPFVKESYVGLKENYEYGLEQNVAVILPTFMVPKKSVPKASTVTRETTRSPIFSTSVKRADFRLRSRSTSPVQISTPKSIVTSGRLSPSMDLFSDDDDDQNPNGANLNQDSNSESASQEQRTVTGSTSNTAGPSGGGTNTAGPSGGGTNTAGPSGGGSNTASTSQAQPTKRRRKRQRLVDTLDDDEVTKKLPKYDIEEILKNKDGKEADLLEPLKTDGILFDKDRKLLMRTLTRHLFYNEEGKFDESKFVKTDEKSGMAASLVAAYPLFADRTNPSKRPWWRIFDPAGPSGYIANCVVGIQRAMNSSNRVRGGGQGKLVEVGETSDGPSAEPTNYTDPDAEWMGLTMPYVSQKSQLIQGMKKSFSIRRKWINDKGPSITEILAKYVHLVSFETEMLEMEFNAMFPEKSMLFLQHFPTLVSAVLRIHGRGNIEVEVLEKGDERDTIEACLFLASKLPRPNLKRFSGGRNTDSVMPAQKTLLACLPRGVNVKDYVKERREKTNGPVQPYLLALVPKAQVSMLYIVVDSHCINLNTSSILKGLDILFKVFFVFNVHFPLGWKMFWGMIENGIFKLDPRKLTNSAKELLLKYKVNN